MDGILRNGAKLISGTGLLLGSDSIDDSFGKLSQESQYQGRGLSHKV
jgi:hypothetical protein